MTEPARFGAAFADRVRRAPAAPALLWRDREISYGELAALTDHQRRLLARVAPADGAPIGILAPKSPESIALVLACLLAGRRFLLPSPALAPEQLDRLFAQAGCTTVLRESDLAVPGAPRPTVDVAVAGVAPDATAFLLTTSGSTGLPKIVPLPHRALDAFAAWAGPAFGIGPGRTVLSYAPLNFDLCLLDIWTTLAHGGRVLLADTALAVRGPYLLDLLRRHPVHVIQAVPMFFGLVLDAARAGGGAPLTGVEHVMVTGDTAGEQVLAGIPGLFPGARLTNIYGCTETNDSFAYAAPPGPPPHPLPIGRPLPGVHVLVVTATGRILDGAGTGELYVSTPFQTPGYLDAARNTGRFVAHPAGADDRVWFRTGDLVRRTAAGEYALVGRTDFQVKVRGVAVNTAEVETVLQAHPDVLEAAVTAEPDPVLGRRLVATVRRAPGSALNSLALRGHCARRLPQAAVPAELRIVEAPLPRTSTGKLDRAAAGSASTTVTGR